MPNTKSAKRTMRTSEISRQKNFSIKSELKTYFKNCDQTIAEKKTDQAGKIVRETIGKLDKAVSKKIIHRNTAARKKSQLMKKLNTI